MLKRRFAIGWSSLLTFCTSNWQCGNSPLHSATKCSLDLGDLWEKMQPASCKSVVLHLGCLRLDCLEPKRGALVRLNDGEAHGFMKLRPSIVPCPGHTSVPCLFRPTHKGKPVGMTRTCTSTSEGSSFCFRRRDLVDVQSEESHAGAEEKHEEVLRAEGHRVALQNFVK